MLYPRPVKEELPVILTPRPLTALPLLQPRPVSTVDKDLLTAQTIIDPKLFAKVWLQTDLWYMQERILDAIATKARVAVKACHSSSKSFTSAIAVLWFLARYEDAVVVTTAPTWHQVEKILWGEIHSALLRSRYDFPKPNLTELKIGPKRYAYGLSTTVTKQDEGVKFQGIHAKNVLVIIDEAPGVNPKLWEAIEGARAGGNVHILAIGNPTIASGPFHTAFTKERSGWDIHTIDAFDTPNLKGLYQEGIHCKNHEECQRDCAECSLAVLLKLPDAELDKNTHSYLTTRRWVVEQYHAWGEDHPFWESRVRGRFPKQSPDSLLSLTWLEQAALRTVPEGDECMAGLDVAGPGEDETSLTIRKGGQVVYHNQWPSSDPRGEVVEALNPYKSMLSSVNIDCIGIGWGMYQHLNDLKFPAIPVNVCEASNDSEKFADIKSEFFWGLRMRFEAGDIGGLTDEKTIGQLAGIRYSPTPRGQVKIESKEDARKRGVKSPDRAESVMLAFGKRVMVFGALDYFKRLKEEAERAKPVAQLAKQSFACPLCTSTCVVVTNGQFRCNQCAHNWPLPNSRKTGPQVITRNSILSNMRGRN